MYIKEIKLSGFKSYKEETVVSDFFDGLNIIVGRNGSGKSNIFSAIEFALTLEYSQCMKPGTRNSLVFQGRDNQQEPAYVEIVFDNLDRKLAVDDDTVTFKRVISTKKDRFLVNGKELIDAKQFLDAAGFTNPYFFVKQGKVHDIALATDAARLKVISDVTGTNAFDAKIAECESTLEAADTKKNDIDKELVELKKRKDSLEEEVAEQRRFMKRDQSKRAIEVVLHGRKLREIEQNVANMEVTRNNLNVRQKPLREELEKVRRDIEILRREVGESEVKIKQLQDLKKDYEASQHKIAADLADRKQELGDLKNKENVKRDDGRSAEEIAEDISKLENLLAATEAKLLQSKELMDKLYIQKSQMSSRVKRCREKDLLNDARGAATSKRDKTENKLKEIKRELKETKTSLESQSSSRAELEKSLQEETVRLQNVKDGFSKLVEDYNTITQKINELRTNEQKTRSRMEANWRESSENGQMIAQKRDRLNKLEEDWKKCAGFEMFHGCLGVKTIINEFKAAGTHQNIINGYYGLVCEIIECDPKLDIAIESAAGKRLLHHVVQSKEVAQVILAEFNKRAMRGEVNFIPIDGLKITHSSQFSGLQGAKPLVDLIRFSDHFTSVTDFVFGNTLLCESFDAATEMMRAHNMQCVTLDGNKVSKVGVMIGGYRSRRPQKLELQRAKSIHGKELITLTEEKTKLDLESSHIKQEMENYKLTHEKLRMQKIVIKEKQNCALSEIETVQKKILSIQETMLRVVNNIADLKARISSLEEEEKLVIGSTEASNDKVQDMKSFRTISNEFMMAENAYFTNLKEKNQLDGQLKQMRKRFYTSMKTTSPSNSEAIDPNREVRLTEEIKSLSDEISKLQKKIDRANRDLTLLQKLVLTKQKSVEELCEQEKTAKEQLMQVCNELDSFASNEAHWLKQHDEQKAIGTKLGSVPGNLDKFENLRDKELYQKLKKVNMKLKDSVKVGVNQKAIQQYEELTEKYSRFENRMNKYRDEKAEMIQFLRDLKAKKGDAMLRNLRLIQKQFQDIFCRIVPQGNAELIFYGQDVTVDHDRNIDDDELREAAGTNVFEGVKVSVNFVGKQLHNIRSLSQLSGGQKSVVALCLILAIQEIDPAPFYIFDEVDQALDAAYRDAVAKQVAEMSKRSQFICTTFRKELLTVADKIFGVSFENRCSHIKPITDAQAFSFVENDFTPMDSSSISPNGSFCHNDSAA